VAFVLFWNVSTYKTQFNSKYDLPSTTLRMQSQITIQHSLLHATTTQALAKQQDPAYPASRRFLIPLAAAL